MELMDGREVRVFDVAWGRDEGAPCDHFTTNISPGRSSESGIDFFLASDVQRVCDAESGHILFDRATATRHPHQVPAGDSAESVAPTTVSVVFDGEFAERIAELTGSAIWIDDSATNRRVIEEMRRVDPSFTVTTFRTEPPSAREFVDLLGAIDLHHGAYSQDPIYDRLVVYGVHPNQEVRAALQVYGFSVTELTSDGFIAQRVAA
ncbi:MAG: hypothetical protein JNL26_19275 [Gemmatimonadetes bacterium]|nr:hypothetical protein [Gemmatimonadota bacterium]